MVDERERFRRWFLRPIEILEQELPDGDGGFAALMVAIPLYERYAVAVLVEAGQKSGGEALRDQLARDFGTDAEDADAFWSVFRVGLAHQGMPKADVKKKLPTYSMTSTHKEPFRLAVGKLHLMVNPWRFVEKVKTLWGRREDLIDRASAFPLAEIRESVGIDPVTGEHPGGPPSSGGT